MTGNGPYAMVVCQAKNGNDCFPAANPPPDVASIDALTTALTPPSQWFATATFPIAYPHVHSWALGREINFWSYTGAAPQEQGPFNAADTGDMDLDDRSLFPPAAATGRLHFTRLFTGFIALPAGLPPGPISRTIAIASDDGYSFAIGKGSAIVPASDFP
ncbi:MAG: hypothetical protein ACJ79O_26010, partial [Myxococcales bacterium]